MIPTKGTPGTPNIAVFWIIWFSILSGLLVIQMFSPNGLPTGVDKVQASIVFPAIGCGLAVAAMAVRFVVIPRLKSLEKKLPAMIVGLAISESIGILGAFVVTPEHGASRLFMLALSLVCLVASAPVYVKSGKTGNPFVN